MSEALTLNTDSLFAALHQYARAAKRRDPDGAAKMTRLCEAQLNGHVQQALGDIEVRPRIEPRAKAPQICPPVLKPA